MCQRRTSSRIGSEIRAQTASVARKIISAAKIGSTSKAAPAGFAPVAIGLARAVARRGVEDRFERFGSAFHERVREGFRAIAAAEPPPARPAAGAPAPDRDFELWLIDGDAPPVSLGVLPFTAKPVIAVGESLRDKLPTGVLAISDEPKGGSPTGLPTGPVLATGKVTAL